MSVTSYANAPIRSECYDANPDFGVGECWNANASGLALNIGVEESGASFGQVVRGPSSIARGTAAGCTDPIRWSTRDSGGFRIIR